MRLGKNETAEISLLARPKASIPAWPAISWRFECRNPASYKGAQVWDELWFSRRKKLWFKEFVISCGASVLGKRRPESRHRLTVVIRGLQGDVVYLEGPIAPSYTSPNAGGRLGGGGCGVSAMSRAVHIT
jgi:hypothetical protein